MTATDERMDKFDARLEAMGKDVRVLKDDVRVLKDDVAGLTRDVTELKEDVHKLRIVVEHHDTEIQRIAEVQAAHGEKLEQHGKLLREIKKTLATDLSPVADFVRRVASEHDARLVRIEKHTGLLQS